MTKTQQIRLAKVLGGFADQTHPELESTCEYGGLRAALKTFCANVPRYFDANEHLRTSWHATAKSLGVKIRTVMHPKYEDCRVVVKVS